MPDSLRIAAVSYTNTFPFVYGIEHSALLKDYHLALLPPAQCASVFESGKADIALVPSGALPGLKDYNIISPYCIGAHNEVKTVLLLSHKKIEDIKSVGLDTESGTSVLLVKVLAKNFWGIKPAWEHVNIPEDYKQAGTDALVVIGDKAVELSSHFSYQADFAAEWKRFTKLPFVFAVWICRNHVSEKEISLFNSALQYGLEHIPQVIKKYKNQGAPRLDKEAYFRENIDFHFDEVKKTSLQKFLTFIADLD
ncbi:MAG: menaquinone biosynthesis protein [Bacteroidales bacterium]|jgi:chorismate dehydratase|nr:menaquinone biosynthesis protein [Bacteroidales bacterium]